MESFMNFIHLLILGLLFVSCVKDEANLGPASTSTGSTSGGSTSGGGSSGETATPDPLVSEAWFLKNTGTQNAFSLATGLNGEDINVDPVHTLLNIRGRNVRIAVSDTGTDIEHEDLALNTLAGEHRNYSFTQPSRWRNANPYPVDEEPHGTGVAGLIAALGWNGKGSRGIAPSAKFASFRYLVDPLPSDTSASLLAKEVDQLEGNFDIFNYSYGTTGYLFVSEESTLSDALKLGATTSRNGKGALYVQSAGNSFYEKFLSFCNDDTDPNCFDEATGNTNAHETLATPYKIVVGATNALGKITSYSTPGSGLWVSAPGGEDGINLPAMITTDISSCNSGYSYRTSLRGPYFDFGSHPLNSSCNYTSRFNGTSSAAPVTSGVIALMLEANPHLTWRDVKHILAHTSDQIDYNASTNEMTHPRGKDLTSYVYDYKWVKNKADLWYSNYYGFGRVNAEEAVTMALTYDLSTLGTYEQLNYDSGALTGLTIPDNSFLGAENKIWVAHNYIVESVQIQFTSNHPWPGEVAIHLVSPQGTESRLLTLNSNIYSSGFETNTLMISNAFYGESTEGFWTIKMYDGDTALGTGQLTNWKLIINGHRNPADLLNPLPVTNINFGPVPASATMSPVFSFIHSPDLLDLDHYEVAVGTAADNENILGWRSIGLQDNGHRLTGLVLDDNTTYYLKIRAVNSTGYSSVQITTWTADY